MKIKLPEKAWQNLVERYKLSPTQLEKFKLYQRLLLEWNQKFNLTAIEDESDIVNYHFNDSLALKLFFDLNKLNMICDVGAGAGFPGLPLKIFAPHLKLILIEVQNKKVQFLQHVIAELQLEQVEIEALDWRTFLRQTNYPIDLFCSRAALSVEELLRVYKPNSTYCGAKLVYWTTPRWSRDLAVLTHVPTLFNYHVGDRNLTLACFEKEYDAEPEEHK